MRSKEGEREGTLMRWGLIPFFARGVPPKHSTINARLEAVETSPTYRRPWKCAQRCIHLADRETFGFAALWDRSIAADGTAIESVVHVTMPGNELLREIHNTGANPYRMPTILREADHEAWLYGSMDEARAALQPYPSGLMVAYQVSTRVNSSKNDDGKLLDSAVNV